MNDVDMEAAAPPWDLPHLPSNISTMILQSMLLSDRFMCVLVCKAWVESSTYAALLCPRVASLGSVPLPVVGWYQLLAA